MSESPQARRRPNWKLVLAMLVSIAGFEELEMLRLVGTQVTDAGLAKLTKLRHLEELDVRDTRVTAKGLDPFRGRPGLRLLGNGDDDPYRGLMFSY